MLHLKELFFPPRCGACQELLPVSLQGDISMLCEDCAAQFKKEMMAQCKECFLPIADCRCLPKIMAARGFTAHVKLALFSDTRYATARGLVLHLKQSADMRYYRELARLLRPNLVATMKVAEQGRAASGKLPINRTVIGYLPRTPAQKRRHGVDQAALLAKALAREIGVPLLSLYRRRSGARLQKELSRRERFDNARLSLVLRRKAAKLSLTDCRVVLVDDVITTGASMAAAAELLQASELIGVSIAVTPRAEK